MFPPVQNEGKVVAPVPITVWYTGKNLHATDGSRSAVSTDLFKGAILCPDPFGHDKGVGMDYCQPEDSAQADNLTLPFVVVDRLTDPKNPQNPQYVDVLPCVAGTVCNASVKANADVATPTLLGPATGDFSLAAKTSVASAKAVREIQAQALETANTSSTAANKPIMFL